MTSFAAGMLFSNRTHVLLGRKAYGKLRGYWSGFGGSLNAGELPSHGAVREVLEELYGIHNQPQLVREILYTLSFDRVTRRRGYSLYRFHFDELDTISRLVQASGVHAPHYGPEVPTSAAALVAAFQPVRRAEFVAIGLFPLAQLRDRKNVDPHVLADVLVQRSSALA